MQQPLKKSERLSRTEWAKTPYARSEAKNPDASITSLLAKYGIEDHQFAQGKGANGRRAVLLRFVMNGRAYRIALETLDADATPEELTVQVKRVTYYYLKSVLEMSNIFISVEEALFAFMELPDGATTFEVAGPLPAQDFMAKLLPPGRT
jgi:hypothetical protein